MRVVWFALVTVILFIPTAAAAIDQPEPARLFVSIEGLNGRALTNASHLLSIYDYHNKVAPGDGRLRYLHNQAPRDFRRALAPYGYYRYEYTSSLENREGNWYANYKITLGEPVPIGNLNIVITGPGHDDPTFKKVIEQLPLIPNSPLRHADYETAKSRLRRHASDRGYYQADFTSHELRIDVASYTADIELVLETGPRYRFGEIIISPGHLDDDVMRRFIGFKEGDYVSSSDLLELQLGFSDSNYFSRVEVQPLWAEASDDFRVPVNIDYEENKRTHYQAGVGYGTDTGPRLKFEQNRRWVNARGHRFSTQVQASEVLTSVGASYTFPGLRPQADQYVLRALWTDENTSTVQSERFTYGASWQSQREALQQIVSLDWQEERDTLDGNVRKTQYLIPSVQWTRVRTANRLNVSDGWRLSLTVRGATEQLLSDSDFLQAVAFAKYVTKVTDRVRFISRAEVGTSITTDFSQVPTSLRFYAGGDRSIRGYAYRSVSPRNDLGEVEGARNIVVGSVETDYEFRPNWRLAAFIDAGNTFNDVNEAFKIGVGVGFRWQSPIGPVRVDFASGLSDPGDSLRLHLTIGPDL